MSTRTSGFVPYNLPDAVLDEPPRLLSLLSTATPACVAVARYWLAQEPDYRNVAIGSWRVNERGNGKLNDWLYDESGDTGLRWWFNGPGNMSIQFNKHVAEIMAGARWRGFLTIPALRQVHREAFKAIARAVGATSILFVPDYTEELVEAAAHGKTFDECRQLIERVWGPSQGDLDSISDAVIADCQNGNPPVWYLEPI